MNPFALCPLPPSADEEVAVPGLRVLLCTSRVLRLKGGPGVPRRTQLLTWLALEMHGSGPRGRGGCPSLMPSFHRFLEGVGSPPNGKVDSTPYIPASEDEPFGPRSLQFLRSVTSRARVLKQVPASQAFPPLRVGSSHVCRAQPSAPCPTCGAWRHVDLPLSTGGGKGGGRGAFTQRRGVYGAGTAVQALDICSFVICERGF